MASGDATCGYTSRWAALMADRQTVQPNFPIPPPEYTQSYMAEVVRSFSVFLQQVINPGAGRASTFVMTNLPTSDSGLEVGGFFTQNGYVLTTRAWTPHPAGLEGTGAVGTLTVTTS